MKSVGHKLADIQNLESTSECRKSRRNPGCRDIEVLQPRQAEIPGGKRKHLQIQLRKHHTEDVLTAKFKVLNSCIFICFKPVV